MASGPTLTGAPAPQAASKGPVEAGKAPAGQPHSADGGHLPAVAAAAGANKNKRCPCPNCRPPAPAPAGAGGGSGSKGSGSFSNNVRGAGSSGTGGPQRQGKSKAAGAGAGGGSKAAAAKKPFNVAALPNKPLMPLAGQQEVQGQKVRPCMLLAMQTLSAEAESGGAASGCCLLVLMHAGSAPKSCRHPLPSVSWPLHLPAFPQPKPKRDNIKTKLQKMAARLIKRKKE